MKLIAISGGIGSGKSIVSRIVSVMGYPVYDCDSRASALMTASDEVRQQVAEAFGVESYREDGTLNRPYLSAKVFGNDEALSRLNSIVHPATASDMLQWAEIQQKNGVTMAFVETALLHTAHIDRLVDEVWHVTAPAHTRVKRVMVRSGLTAQQVQNRMAAQAIEEEPVDGEQVIINDDVTAVLPQVMRLIINNE
jgi:dephospho-CoA kinase